MKIRLLFSMIVLLLLASPILRASVTNYEYDDLDRTHRVRVSTSH